MPKTKASAATWTPEVKAFYSRFPALLRSKHWPELAKLVRAGKGGVAIAGALDIEAKDPQIRAQNIAANRLRIRRVDFFKRVNQAERALRVIFARLGNELAAKVEQKATSTGKVPGLIKDAKATAQELRGEMSKWLRGVLSDSTVIALKNAGDAFHPILKDMVKQSNESFDFLEMFHVEQSMLFVATSRLLSEAPRNFTTQDTSQFSGKVDIWSQKWQAVRKKIVKTILVSNKLGTSAKSRIVELAARAGTEMSRIIANDVAQGVAPATIARKIKKFMSPQVTDAIERGERLPPGVYRSIFKNAMRLARTEANQAYTNASAEWAKDKSFIKGVTSTLSSAHDQPDECDDIAAQGVMTPEEFQDQIPAHPHCMCYPTYVVEDRFLDQEAA